MTTNLTDYGSHVRDNQLSPADLDAIDVWGRRIALAVRQGNDAQAHELVETASAELRREPPLSPLADIYLAELGIEVRTTNALETLGVRTVGDLLEIEPGELQTISHVGQRVLLQVAWRTLRCLAGLYERAHAAARDRAARGA